MRNVLLVVPAFCLAGLIVAGCGGIADPSKNTIENFENIAIEPGQGRVHEFDVRAKNGEYSATITALAPTQSAVLQIFLGGVVNGLCQPYLGAVTVALFNRVALSGPINQGHYCIQVYDQANLTVAHTYTLRVSHP